MNFFKKANNFFVNLPVEIYFVIFVGYFFARNIFMPLCYDDYNYAFVWDGAHGGNLIDGINPENLHRVESFADIFVSQISHYFTWGGRVFGHGLAQLCF